MRSLVVVICHLYSPRPSFMASLKFKACSSDHAAHAKVFIDIYDS